MPNILFLFAFTGSALDLPRFLVPVKPIEPVLYRGVGVGLVKEDRGDPYAAPAVRRTCPQKLKNNRESLDHAELTMMGGGMPWRNIHLDVSRYLYYLAVGRIPESSGFLYSTWCSMATLSCPNEPIVGEYSKL